MLLADSLTEFILDDLIDLELTDSQVVAFDDFPDRGHWLDLEPARSDSCKFFDLAQPLMPVDKFANRPLLIYLVNKDIHLNSSCAAHLEDVSNLVGKASHSLILLLINLIIDNFSSLLPLFSDFIFNFLD